MRLLAIAGSLRRSSFNRALLRAAAECVPPGVEIVIWDRLASIPLFTEELETGGGPEAVALLRREVAAADGLLIATPEYNQSIPGVLKNAIDWLSRPAPEEVLVGKPVAVIGASSGRWGTRLSQSSLRHVFNATESLVMANPTLYVREAGQMFDAEGRLVDQPTKESLRKVLAAFGKWITLVTRTQ